MVTRRNPVLRAGEMFDGTEVVSERSSIELAKTNVQIALEELQKPKMGRDFAIRRLREAFGVLVDMQKQLRAGVHVNPRRHRANPALVIYGNPGRQRGGEVCLSKGQVQAIIYTHERDGSDRVHGFGDADIQLSNDGGALVIEGLEQHTGMSMYGTVDKQRIIVRGDQGQKVWDFFPDEE